MISTFLCPKGHSSTEADYCSECGARIVTNLKSDSILTKTEKKLEICPDCAAPHEADSGNFCEICGYNFLTKAQGELPIISTELTITESAKQPEIDSFQSSQWQVLVLVDRTPHDPLSPSAPSNQLPISIELNKPVNLIGRTSQVRAIFPEIPLDLDDAVSSRHALLICQPDGILLLRDIGSSNGTVFRGVELKPMTDVPLEDGDEFTLGHWSRIVVKRLSGNSSI